MSETRTRAVVVFWDHETNELHAREFEEEDTAKRFVANENDSSRLNGFQEDNLGNRKAITVRVNSESRLPSLEVDFHT